MFNKIYRFIYPEQNPLLIQKEYNIPKSINLKFRLEGGWFIMFSPEYPGLITQAKDQKELFENLNDAVLTYFDVPKSVGDIVFDQINMEGGVVLQYDHNKRQLQTA